MSTQKKVTLKRGTTIAYEGKNLSLIKPITVKVLEKKADSEQAEAKTDTTTPVDKETVLALIKKEIETLDTREQQLMRGGILEDEGLLDEGEQELQASYSAAAHVAITVEIATLKKLLKKVEKL